jgi:tetratricopeptide (TPR) repeat protein
MSARTDERAAALLANGFQELQQGRSEQARVLGQRALEIAPRNPDALQLLGVIALQRSDHAAAADLFKRAIAVRPDDPAFLCNLAYAYVGLQRLADALAAFERAVRLEPRDPELQLGLGSCLAMSGKSAQAEAVFRRLVEQLPQYPLGWFNLANVVRDQERYEEARQLYLRAAALAPQLVEAKSNLGIVLHKLGRFEEAEAAYRECLAARPDFIPAYVNLATTLIALRRHAEAEAVCRASLARDPGQKNALPVLGYALTGQGKWTDALRAQEEAARLFPDSCDAAGDLGAALANVGRVTDALAAYDRAIAIGPASDLLYHCKGAALLASGRFAEGFEAHGRRPARSDFLARQPAQRLAAALPGELSGREVGLIGEQGIGDELFFLRYAPHLKARGARLHYYCNPKLAGIVARDPLFETVHPNAPPYGGHDCSVLAGDLPRLLGAEDGAAATLPPPLPLQPLPERVAAITQRLRALGPPPHIGITWRAGTPALQQRGYIPALCKEIPPGELAAALKGLNATFVSVQRAPHPGETQQLAALLDAPLHDFSPANDDLEEMLALLAALDDYVGVSNTNTHLRAGVGKSARVLVPWPAEWRWMAAGGESPWFPGFTIYRQHLDAAWNDAVARLREDLRGGRDDRN